MRKGFNPTVVRILSVLIGLVVAFSSPASGEVVDRIIANVNGEIILLSELQEEVAQAQGLRQNPEEASAALEGKEILNNMIDGKLQVHYAKKLRFKVTEDDVLGMIEGIKKGNGLTDEQLGMALKQRGISMEDFKSNLRNRILMNRVVRSEVDSKIRIYDREIINYYQTHSQNYLSDESVHAGHIIVICSIDADPETEKRARTKIERAMEEIKGGKPFAPVAKEYSDGPNASKGGDLGTFKRGHLVASFEDKVFALKSGEVSDVFRLETGFHIVKVYEKQTAGVRPLADVRSEVEDELYKEKRKKRYKEWMKSLKKGSYIEILY